MPIKPAKPSSATKPSLVKNDEDVDMLEDKPKPAVRKPPPNIG
jgi:hypothetical protein